MAFVLPAEVSAAVNRLGSADIVVGIPSYNNAGTIGHVVRAAQAGLAKYFPNLSSAIINSDGGSRDATRDVVLSATLQDPHLLLLATPMPAVHRLSFPYHGIPGKGSAFRMIFAIADHLGAKACAVLDSDLRSITPEWIDLLLRPILEAGFEFVAPYYRRHKYDGTITNSIVYPLTRALYGQQVRQPIGGDFGVSPPLIRRYLRNDNWEGDVARYGIDIWMTTIAMAEDYRMCQSFLGAKLHDAKDPGADLSAMLHQVVGSVFSLMEDYEGIWTNRTGSVPVPMFGFGYSVGLDPIPVNIERMLAAFDRGRQDLGEIWRIALRRETLAAVMELGRRTRTDVRQVPFHLPDDLWFRVIAEFAVAYHRHPVERAHLLRSLTPLYLARVASFVIEAAEFDSTQAEERIERLCRVFEDSKEYLVSGWRQSVEGRGAIGSSVPRAPVLVER